VQVALRLADGADQQSGSLNEFLVLFFVVEGSKTAANM
jgi:hypothetical protein